MKNCSVCLREVKEVATITIKLWEKEIHVCSKCSLEIDRQLNGNNLWTNPSLVQLEYHRDNLKIDLDRMVEDKWNTRRTGTSLRLCYENKVIELRRANRKLEEFKENLN